MLALVCLSQGQLRVRDCLGSFNQRLRRCLSVVIAGWLHHRAVGGPAGSQVYGCRQGLWHPRPACQRRRPRGRGAGLPDGRSLAGNVAQGHRKLPLALSFDAPM
eukprot:scaffold8398_cov20-Prasinocladus_malaysianus.AAC.1